MTRRTWGRRSALLVLVQGLALAGPARAEEIVQLPAAALLDGRPVSTLTGGAVVPWTVGIDKDDAYMTSAAAASLHQTGPALPDDGRFAANADHPEVMLHFSNAAPPASPQAHLQTAVGSFVVMVPPAAYRKAFLFLTSSYGDAPLSIKLSYADKTTTTATFTLPDWGTGAALPTNPPIFFNLIAGLHKWNKAGASLDTPSHTITGVVLTPAPDRTLTAIEISKTTAAPWLTFWGATAIATSASVGGDAGAPDSPDSPDSKVPTDAASIGDADVSIDQRSDDGGGAAGGGGAATDAGVAAAGAGGGAATGGAAGAAAGAGVTGAAGLAGGLGAGGAGGVPRSSGGCALWPRQASRPFGLAVAAFAIGLASRRRRRGAR